jgi:uncharacterized ferritin-like protein (DUF455 family)
MELRAFAERVLHGSTLEDKLSDPGELTDAHPGAAIAVPEAPGRPASLRFKTARSGRQEHPSDARLSDPTERGRLLHFFANHELLATELMALVLLRFPEAPADFRRGVARTLRDEQRHTRIYLERMAACGVGFGDLPVSGYFWRAVAPMEHPLDYVSRLSLTFEQANLDFAQHFSQRFAAVGDAETASILDGIYRDEIGHVAYGLKWFRRWKQPGDSDWEAFCRQLQFPLSPSRAKGFSVNIAGRRAAGLDPDFIQRLQLHAQSKGRAPVVGWFNPFAEGHLAHGPHFTPVRAQAELAADLETLPAFVLRQDDVVLVREAPSDAWRADLQQVGVPLPEWVVLPTGPSGPGAVLAGRKLRSLRPWAWGPDSLRMLGTLIPQISDGGPPAVVHEEGQLAELYSKVWSAQQLRDFLNARPGEPWLCPVPVVGVPAHSVTEALDAVARIRSTGHHRVVVKEALGLAGHNALRLWEPEILPTQVRWLERVTAGGRAVVVEPWLERMADFSLQLEIEERGPAWKGVTVLETDHRGQYLANRVQQPLGQLPAALAGPLRANGATDPILRDFLREIVATFGGLLHTAGFRGPAGIDALIYRDATGQAVLKPVVEINPRHTMGRVALELMRHVCPGSTGRFEIRRIPRKTNDQSAAGESLADELRALHPREMAGEPTARIRQGVVFLNDPSRARTVLATFTVQPPGHPPAHLLV